MKTGTIINYLSFTIAICCAGVCAISCDGLGLGDIVENLNGPKSITGDVSEITECSAVFAGQAKIPDEYTGNIALGFYFSKYSDMPDDETYYAFADNCDKDYNYQIEVTGFDYDTRYYYKSVLVYNDEEYYGATKTFKTKDVDPKITLTPMMESIEYCSANKIIDVSIENEYKGGQLIAVSQVDWIVDISVSDKVVYYTVMENDTQSARTGTILVKYGKATALFTVKQGFKEPSDFQGHYAVDLGMVVDGKKVYWATCNLGASKSYETGKYYAWGETSAYGEKSSGYPSSFSGVKNNKYLGLSSKTCYYWANYKYCNGSEKTLTKYNSDETYGVVDNKDTLDEEDDAARVNWGGTWRMPTNSEWSALLDKTNFTWTWTTLNGVEGYKITSNIAGYTNKYLFLPSVGSCIEENCVMEAVVGMGQYWSNSIMSMFPQTAYCLYFSSSSIGKLGSMMRYVGYPIRPVSY